MDRLTSRLSEGDIMFAALLSLFLFGLVGIIVISIVMALIGIVFSVTLGIVGFLLFKVAPLLFVGWLVLKFLDRNRGQRHRPISAADQRWLDS
jgi:positive regulator of sigma E activity